MDSFYIGTYTAPKLKSLLLKYADVIYEKKVFIYVCFLISLEEVCVYYNQEIVNKIKARKAKSQMNNNFIIPHTEGL